MKGGGGPPATGLRFSPPEDADIGRLGKHAVEGWGLDAPAAEAGRGAAAPSPALLSAVPCAG